jgi:hypothetical protein
MMTNQDHLPGGVEKLKKGIKKEGIFSKISSLKFLIDSCKVSWRLK